jgi:hypothetical protein
VRCVLASLFSENLQDSLRIFTPGSPLPFSLPLGETDAPAPVRAKEWAKGEGEGEGLNRLNAQVQFKAPSSRAFAVLWRGRQSSPRLLGDRRKRPSRMWRGSRRLSILHHSLATPRR